LISSSERNIGNKRKLRTRFALSITINKKLEVEFGEIQFKDIGEVVVEGGGGGGGFILLLDKKGTKKLEHLKVLVKFIQFCTLGACAQVFVGKTTFATFGVIYKF
jgi:hypothetical protein